MRIGLVYFPGLIGDQVRIDAIRRFLAARPGFEVRDLPCERVAPRVDMVRELVSWRALRHAAAKLARREHPFLMEMQWSIETRTCDADVDRVHATLREAVHGVDVLLAEGLVEGLACARLGSERRIPFVFDMHGVLAEEAKLRGSTEWSAWCARREREVVEQADRVLVVSPLMRAYVHHRLGRPLDRIDTVPNGTDPSERRAAYSDPLTVVYAGNFAPYENVLEFLELAAIAAGDDHRFWLLGDGMLRDRVFDTINSRALDVLYFGRKPRSAALDICARAQVGFAGQTGAVDLARDFPRQLGCPIKLFDYASCGLPLLVPRGEWSPVIEETDCGIVVGECAAPALLEGLGRLRDRSAWDRMARNAKEVLAPRFAWSEVLKPLADALEKARG